MHTPSCDICTHSLATSAHAILRHLHTLSCDICRAVISPPQALACHSPSDGTDITICRDCAAKYTDYCSVCGKRCYRAYLIEPRDVAGFRVCPICAPRLGLFQCAECKQWFVRRAVSEGLCLFCQFDKANHVDQEILIERRDADGHTVRAYLPISTSARLLAQHSGPRKAWTAYAIDATIPYIIQEEMDGRVTARLYESGQPPRTIHNDNDVNTRFIPIENCIPLP